MNGIDDVPVLDSVEINRLQNVARDFPAINGVPDALPRLLKLATTDRPCEHDSDCRECQDKEDDADRKNDDAREAIQKVEDEIETMISDKTLSDEIRKKLESLRDEIHDAGKWL